LVEKKTIAYTSLGGIGVVLLTLFGANLFDGTHYYCAEKNISSTCDRFSSTGVTCYPQPLINTGSKTCSAGWALIVADPVIEQPVTPVVSSDKPLQYSCDQKGCVRI